MWRRPPGCWDAAQWQSSFRWRAATRKIRRRRGLPLQPVRRPGGMADLHTYYAMTQQVWAVPSAHAGAQSGWRADSPSEVQMQQGHDRWRLQAAEAGEQGANEPSGRRAHDLNRNTR